MQGRTAVPAVSAIGWYAVWPTLTLSCYCHYAQHGTHKCLFLPPGNAAFWKHMHAFIVPGRAAVLLAFEHLPASSRTVIVLL